MRVIHHGKLCASESIFSSGVTTVSSYISLSLWKHRTGVKTICKRYSPLVKNNKKKHFDLMYCIIYTNLDLELDQDRDLYMICIGRGLSQK